jgi:hypothetical protein
MENRLRCPGQLQKYIHRPSQQQREALGAGQGHLLWNQLAEHHVQEHQAKKSERRRRGVKHERRPARKISEDGLQDASQRDLADPP